MIKYEDALQAITKNLDRINGHKEGTGLLVAMDWLADLEVVEHDEVGS